MTQVSGLTSADQFGAMLRAAVADPDVKAIVADVDSPGGSVFGMEELAATIRDLRGEKPMVAVANPVAASAAYWIASQFDEVIATPSAQVGSIGVVAVHRDMSGMNEKLGVKPTYITAGKYKAEGNSDTPLGDDAKQAMQRLADQYYGAFVESVAASRGVKAEAVRDGYGEGRVLSARDARRERMIDGIATLEQVVGKLAAGAVRVSGARAEDATPEVGAVEPEPVWQHELAAFRARLAAR
jgi:signal peptide peptidase SppA